MVLQRNKEIQQSKVDPTKIIQGGQGGQGDRKLQNLNPLKYVGFYLLIILITFFILYFVYNFALYEKIINMKTTTTEDETTVNILYNDQDIEDAYNFVKKRSAAYES